MLTLYFARNTCSLAPHLALEFAGADYRGIRVDFATEEQRSAQYRQINPKARVPALVTEHGVLTETPAMLQYIAQTHPRAQLAPLADAFALARMNAFDSYLCSTLHVAHAHRMRGYRWADSPQAWEAMKAKVPQSVGEAFAFVESDAAFAPWVLGKDFSVADCYLFTVSRWLESDGVDPAPLPKVLAHRARMLELAPVQRVLSVVEG